MIYNRIKVLRAERNWTQADLAYKVGISRQAVISIEKYKYVPSLELAFKIAEVFDVSMNEQLIILFFLIIGVAATLFLYIWKAKKEIEYKKDERWQVIQNRANSAANVSNYILILVVTVLDILVLYADIQISLTWNRFLTWVILFIAMRNALELAALLYFDKKM